VVPVAGDDAAWNASVVVATSLFAVQLCDRSRFSGSFAFSTRPVLSIV
jgi:hypothetical protein